MEVCWRVLICSSNGFRPVFRTDVRAPFLICLDVLEEDDAEDVYPEDSPPPGFEKAMLGAQIGLTLAQVAS